MKYQSVILEASSADVNQVKKILEENFDISKDIPETNIKTISKTDQKESIGIKEVSELTEWAYGRNESIRLLIIERADLLTDQAQNSLLKLVEEPPENIFVVLVTNNINSLLQTIVSRCLKVKDPTVKSIIKNDDVLNFINANHLERNRIIDKMISDDISRNELSVFIEEILKIKLEKKDTKNIDEIKNVFRGVKRGVNLKLCFDYLNTLLD